MLCVSADQVRTEANVFWLIESESTFEMCDSITNFLGLVIQLFSSKEDMLILVFL